ncbi:jg1445 [Pararge aegeria aegeria]|uniref:Jg1445 protein n=1 Tax=Pararge aegeria aegeria TaxID=348720 RepID=A0A8S4SQQ7_9NEOP|nr:jg1445 [Pararge aegeria aegeria]
MRLGKHRDGTCRGSAWEFGVTDARHTAVRTTKRSYTASAAVAPMDLIGCQSSVQTFCNVLLTCTGSVTTTNT